MPWDGVAMIVLYVKVFQPVTHSPGRSRRQDLERVLHFGIKSIFFLTFRPTASASESYIKYGQAGRVSGLKFFIGGYGNYGNSLESHWIREVEK